MYSTHPKIEFGSDDIKNCIVYSLFKVMEQIELKPTFLSRTFILDKRCFFICLVCFLKKILGIV